MYMGYSSQALPFIQDVPRVKNKAWKHVRGALTPTPQSPASALPRICACLDDANNPRTSPECVGKRDGAERRRPIDPDIAEHSLARGLVPRRRRAVGESTIGLGLLLAATWTLHVLRHLRIRREPRQGSRCLGRLADCVARRDRPPS